MLEQTAGEHRHGAEAAVPPPIGGLLRRKTGHVVSTLGKARAAALASLAREGKPS